MSAISILVILYSVAVLLLVAEIFVPSHAVLSIVGIGFLIFAIVKTFEFGTTIGTIAIVASLIFIPSLAVAAVKVWPNTRIGKLISPPNPEYTSKDFGSNRDELELLLGKYGRAVSPLRPVGTCEFAGRRLQCVSESGMIDADVKVVAVGIRGRNLEVAIAEDSAGD
jgi:membrane-bound serine protease (ClpP class)